MVEKSQYVKQVYITCTCKPSLTSYLITIYIFFTRPEKHHEGNWPQNRKKVLRKIFTGENNQNPYVP